MNEDQEVIIVEAPVETEVPEIEEEAVEVAEPVADAAQAPNARDAAYQYLRDNPDELRDLARVAQRMTAQEVQQQRLVRPEPPDEADYPTWEQYHAAVKTYQVQMADYTDRAIEAAVTQATSKLASQYDPIVEDQAVTKAVGQIASKFGVPEEAKGFIAENLRGLSPQIIAGLDDGARRILALAAKGEALERGAMPTGRTNGKNIPAAEPVAGIGPVSVQLAEGVTRGELDAYLKMTGKTMNRDTVAALRKDGYLK